MAGEPIIAQHGGKVKKAVAKSAEEQNERQKAEAEAERVKKGKEALASIEERGASLQTALVKKHKLRSDPIIKDATPESRRIAAQNFLLRGMEFYAGINKKTKYNHIRRVRTSEPATLINRLTRTPSVVGINKFLQIKPHQIATLVPTIRLFLVYSGSDKSKKHKSIELKFEDKTSSDVAIITSDSRGRGGGVGVKSFKVETQGRNPAEGALVKCDLEVFFQNIEMLATQSEQKDPSSTDYIELILRRTKNPAKTHDSRGNEIPYSRITNRFGFRLMAVVGWATPQGDSVDQNLKDLLRETQEVIYLHLINHTIDFNQDGTGLLTCNYQGAIEKAFSSDMYDVLAVSEQNKLQEKVNSLEEDISKKQKEGEKIQKSDKDELKKGQDQITKLKEEQQKLKETLRAQRYAQLMSMIISPRSHTNKLHTVDLTEHDMKRFRRGDTFGPSSGPPPKEDATAVKQLDKATSTAWSESMASLVGKPKKEQNTRISFIFFGDIIEAAKAVVEKNFKNSKTAKVDGLDDFEVLLGPLTFKKKVGTKYVSGIVNLADVPISLKSFEIWFDKNIKKQNLDSFSLRAFLRSATSELVLVALGQFMGLDKKMKIKNQIGVHTFMGKPLPAGMSTIDLDGGARLELIKTKDLARPAGELKNMKPYVVLYASLEVPDTRVPNVSQDVKDGIYHLHLGSDRGIVKSINFSKTDVPYNKESRLTSQDAEEGQLRDKYDATIELIGSSFLFRPGQKLYLNPTLSGFGNINSEKSVARLLGLGGYYDIITVSSEFSRDSGYTTSLKCAWTSFGGLTKVNQQTETFEDKMARRFTTAPPKLSAEDRPQQRVITFADKEVAPSAPESLEETKKRFSTSFADQVGDDRFQGARQKLENAETALRNAVAAARKHEREDDPKAIKEIEKLKERVALRRREYDEAAFDALEEGK